MSGRKRGPIALTVQNNTYNDAIYFGDGRFYCTWKDLLSSSPSWGTEGLLDCTMKSLAEMKTGDKIIVIVDYEITKGTEDKPRSVCVYWPYIGKMVADSEEEARLMLSLPKALNIVP